MTKRGFIAAAFVLLAIVPFAFIGHPFTLLDCLLALGICLVPAGLSLIIVRLTPAEQGIVAILGGSLIRMTFVLIGGLLKQWLDPGTAETFWLLLGFNYLLVLAAETTLLVRMKTS